MESIPENLDPKVVKDFERFLYYRRQSEAKDSQIAVLLDYGSPKAMYRRFKQAGFPVCAVSGAMPVKGEHCKPSKSPRNSNTGTGQRQELPPIVAARPLDFRRDV
jgi:hypothetical protein